MNEASLRQIAAARPNSSTWVSANAGSGKTKVLTDRVARLLLAGTPPQHILCLTYTKAAASEMQNRLFKRLGAWAMMPDEALLGELGALDPEATLTPENIRHARTLFARAIETPGGLKIQTIHSFCGSLLRRFPLEAGVSPQFTELDERRTVEILQTALDEMAQGPRRDIIDGIAPYLSSLDATDLARSVVYKRDSFQPDTSQAQVWEWFNLPADFNTTALLGSVFLGDEDTAFQRAIVALEASANKTDTEGAQTLKNWIGAPRTLGLLKQCCKALLVGRGDNEGVSKFGRARGGFPTKKCAGLESEALRQLGEFMKRVEAAADRMLALQSAQKTLALHVFANAILPAYTEAKERLGLLDFDDLIQKARDLLSISSVAQWVLFRLDGGIDHILVDEAQDTSPDQWTVIRLLAEEFTVGEGARPDTTRTVFVVGDQKQSIYSFQGAAPDAFDEMKEHFKERLQEVGEPLQDIALQHSFRSSPAILKLTDDTFAHTGGHGVGGATHHIAFFEGIPGRVDLWPLLEPEKSTPAPEDWENPLDLKAPEHHTNRLANMIARNVKHMLDEGTVPRKSGGGVKVKPGDILILVRNRSGLFYPMLRALKKLSLPVAGADQLELNEELAVQDLTSLLAFLSMPDDDLALAEALKSPLFGWTEQDLFSLAHKRKSITLWRELFLRQKDWPETFAVLDELRKEADFLRPYDLIQRVLIRHKGRTKFLARLGDEAEDGLDALLNQALAYESTETPSLTGFIGWLGATDIKLKRVLDESSNLIRVMTVHGSKGLEAPIVILPDTLREVSSPKDEMITIDDGRLVWKSARDSNPKIVDGALSRLQAKNDEEERRLLYVAMTRAENWLIVAGAGRQKADGTCWYSLIENGMKTADAAPHVFEAGEGLRYEHATWPSLTDTEDAAERVHVVERAEWTLEKAQQDADKARRLSPSDLGGAKALPGESDYFDEETSLRRGRQLHLLLEHLPAHPEAEWATHAERLLVDGEDRALSGEIAPLYQEARGVLTAQYKWDIFGHTSFAEIPFSATLPSLLGVRIHGVIDRLIVSDSSVFIVDYKSNTTVPIHSDAVPEGILRQLGAYAEACSALYPDKEIHVGILWTKTANLMPIRHDKVIAALKRASLS